MGIIELILCSLSHNGIQAQFLLNCIGDDDDYAEKASQNITGFVVI